MFYVSHHLLQNAITSVKYNNQERRLSLFLRRKDFHQKKGQAEMDIFDNAVVFRTAVEVGEY